MTGWTLAKYVLALLGVVIVLLADRLGTPTLGWVGLGLVMSAFFLRFWQRLKERRRSGEDPPA